MKNRLSLKETIIIASTLFGMFFGAGNLIFPIHLGQLAGSNTLLAIIGFCITAVTIPVLGVVAIGITNCQSVYELSSKISKKYGLIFTCLLYLTIGPLFATPRCATTTYSVGIAPLFGVTNDTIPQLIFTFLFFLATLIFALRSNEIMKWIGKVINPLFLIFYSFLIIIALINPGASISSITPIGDYATSSFFNSFIEGYGTMDALAGLCFGIVIIDSIKSLGIKESENVGKSVIKSGIFTMLLLAIIYAASIIVGVQSRGLFELSENGGIALAQIANHYLGTFGNVILALIILFACLKTAISLVVSCSEMFVKLFPNSISYKATVYVFCIFSFVISNVGLTKIIEYSLPMLMLLYPLAIVLIIMGIFEKFFGKSKYVYCFVTAFTFIPAFFDFLKTLPFNIDVSFIGKIIPFFDLGFGWIVPALLGLVIGLIFERAKINNR